MRYVSVQHIWNLSQQIYLETSSLKHANNVPKLPGVDYVVKNWALAMTLKALPLVHFHQNPANKLGLAGNEQLRQAGFQFDLPNAPNLLVAPTPKNNSKQTAYPSGCLVVNNWRNIVVRCKFLVSSFCNVNDAAQGLWYFARSWSHEIQVNPWNSQKHAKYRKIW